MSGVRVKLGNLSFEGFSWDNKVSLCVSCKADPTVCPSSAKCLYDSEMKEHTCFCECGETCYHVIINLFSAPRIQTALVKEMFVFYSTMEAENVSKIVQAMLTVTRARRRKSAQSHLD